MMLRTGLLRRIRRPVSGPAASPGWPWRSRSEALVLLGAVWYGNRPGSTRAEDSIHFKRGDILVDQGKMDEAAAEFREAIRIDPELAEAHVYLGTILGHQKKLDEAAAEFREAIRIDPGMAEAHVYLGKILGHQGKLRGSRHPFAPGDPAQAR